ncbi:hypothetical protein MRY88_27830 (plasmid) [Bacillus cereus]|uniref:Lethal factor domain protein n=1 Tax=Bacillus cereus (strain 03BB102) TaxID=572264 RepID=A0A125Y9S1_BACC3|nr:hypothetical protein [Bacillus cereus]ACO25661.1 lethal factor domain protein [Bacillus cereus 03BB102]AJG51305.1 hypothetical protein AS54_5485 [Bacillus cereus 03BB102]QPR80810.1 hypothetical protein I6G75_00215 [Bacillus cereus]
MKIKKSFVKVLSMSFLITVIATNTPIFTTFAHGAMENGDVIRKKESENGKKKKEDEKREKIQEERKKEITKHIVKAELKNEDVLKKDAVESLLRKLPVNVLELYHRIDGKIIIVDEVNKKNELPETKQVENIDGETVELNQHYVYGEEGDSPRLVIKASEDYEYNQKQVLNVYYEIGKLLSKIILNKIIQPDNGFVDALNMIKKSPDTDGQDLLFSSAAKEYSGGITTESLKQDNFEAQKIFAKSFAYYNEPHNREILQTYAEPMFNYMKNLNEDIITPILEEKRLLSQRNLGDKLKELKANITKNINYSSGDINKINDPKVQKGIEEINEMIKRPENKLEKPKTIYLYFRAQDLGYRETNNIVQINNGTINSDKIDRKKVSNVLDHFKDMKFTDFKVGHLTNSGREGQERFLVKLQLPEGTYLGDLGDGRVVLPLDYGMSIVHSKNLLNSDRPKINTDNQQEIISVVANLVKKEVIEKKITDLEASLNNEVNLKFGEVNQQSNLIKFDLDGLSISYAMKNAKKAILDLIGNRYIPRGILKDILLTLKQEGGIVITDNPINGDPSVGGNTDQINNVVKIKMAPRFLAKHSKDYDLSRTLIHELGHVLDKKILGNGEYISNDLAFREIFKEEKDKISQLNTEGGYATHNTHEFFAEVFKSMYSTDSEQHSADKYHKSIKEEAPKAVAYIKEKINQYLRSKE